MDEPRLAMRSVATEVAPPSWAWSESLPYTRYAGFWRRFFARAIDGFLIGIVLKILDSIMERVIERNSFNLDIILMWLAVWIVSYITLDWLYYALQESSTHQATVGKRALGIVVTDLVGNRMSFGRATGRYFAHAITFITFGIGYLIQPFTNRRQALHDLIAGTLVERN
jgi:uncharacterized RDD family membrane protein YckC